ncbi:MAG: C45 family autoproteolytic acyltransferase/hydrolase [Candidatus Aenigmarchaeota archaeon]|nr:C45 family autoproteolytic acyltransferase/hydrolase [Candidatus Aenigmarchaeota archaeon]
MENKFLLPVYSVKGTNYEIGYKIGQKFREQIAYVVKNNRRLKVLRKLEQKNPRLETLVAYGNYFRQYMDEIRGIADGSGSNLTDIQLMNCHYDFPRRGCTTVLFKEPGRIILAHNEDNSRDYLNNCYILKVQPKGGTPFISYCYPGMIPGNSFAFNSNGIAITCNAMPTPDIRTAIPRHLIDRSMLEAENMKDVIKRVLLKERASGGSFNVVSMKENWALNIETTSEDCCITEVEDRLLHTNHYVSSGLCHLERDESLLSSTSRYKVGSRLLQEVKEKTPQAALDILSSKEASPYSILRIDKLLKGRTLCTALFDVSVNEMTMRVYEPKPSMQEEGFVEGLKLSLDDFKI